MVMIILVLLYVQWALFAFSELCLILSDLGLPGAIPSRLKSHCCG